MILLPKIRPTIVAWVVVICVSSIHISGIQATYAQSNNADKKSVTIGDWHEIESKILGETRRYIVSTPEGYSRTKEKYTVIYLLDGPGHFHHTTGLVDFLVSNKRMPRSIVVAVANTNRTRDLTPPVSKVKPKPKNGGGADQFVAFFRDELIPHIEKNYRTTKHRTLIGHSYGGLFAVHTLVNHSDVFDAYLAISPSMQWDDQHLVSQAESFFEKHSLLDKKFYMTAGNEGAALTGGILKIAGILTEHKPSGFKWDHRIMPEEDHNSVVYRSTRQGLEFIFSDWYLKDGLATYNLGGVAAIQEFYKTSSEKYGLPAKAPRRVIFQTAFELIKRGRMEEGLDLVEHDVTSYKPVPFFYEQVASRYLKKSDKAAAIKTYERLLKQIPDHQETKEKLNRLVASTKSPDKSKPEK